MWRSRRFRKVELLSDRSREGARSHTGTEVAAWIDRRQALALAAVLAVACAGPPLRIEYESDGHLLTSWGNRLYRMRADGVGAVYLKPGVQFATYAEVVIKPVEVSYKNPPRPMTSFSQRIGNYALDQDSMDRLKRGLRRVLARELAGSKSLTVVSDEGPNRLVVYPRIVGLVWEVPLAQGGESSLVHRTGAMTLISEIRDSQTGELLVYVADRRDIRPQDTGLIGGFVNRPSNNWAGVRNVSTLWARLLRETLDALRELPPMPRGVRHVPPSAPD